MIVIDTNVLSEMMKVAPESAVVDWLRQQDPGQVFTTAITEAEVFCGIQLLPPGKRRDLLLSLANAILTTDFRDRILPFDSTAARIFAGLAASRRASGKPMSNSDAQIASIAKAHKAVLATRNTRDFANCGIDLIDPWRV